MTTPASLVDNIRIYLRRHGWVEQQPGVAGALWADQRRSDRGAALLAIPNALRTDEPEWSGVLDRLSAAEERPPELIARSIEYILIDVTHLRAANDYVIRGSIPLTAGVSLVDAAHRMLRASATTARSPRGHIAGNFSKRADDIVGNARLAHTEEGSYILPLLMPLSPPETLTSVDSNMFGDEAGVDRVSPEPEERRVTRTLAQALTAVQNRIIEPARTPRSADMAPLISAGASRELVTALAQVLNQSAVATFEARFEWAGGFTAPAAIPRHVEIPSEATDLLDQTARLLGRSSRESEQRITGPIIEVRHVPGDRFGEIALQTTRRGRPVEIRVRVVRGSLDEMHDWMRTARTMVVEGPVLRTPGRPLRIDTPTNIYPLDSTYLVDPPPIPTAAALPQRAISFERPEFSPRAIEGNKPNLSE